MNTMINSERVVHKGFRKDTINICSRCHVCFDGMCDFIFGDKAFPGLSLQQRICKNSTGQDMTVYKVVSCSQFEPMEESFKNGRNDIE